MMLAAWRIPADECLPQLADVASEEAMSALFAAHLAPGWSLRSCRIKDARYYPGYTCLLAYNLKCTSPAGEEAAVTLYGRAFGTEPVPEAFRARRELATAVGPLPSFLPPLALGLWTFPDDPGMQGLGEVWRAGGGLFERPDLLHPAPWGTLRPDIDTTLVSYVPSKRCILRYDTQDEVTPTTFFGKVYAAEDAAALYGTMQELWSYARLEAPELRLGRPLGHDARLNAVWQASPGGEPLLEVLEEADLPAVFRRTAAALAALHRGDMRPARRWCLREETDKLWRSRAALLRFYPMLEHDIEAVLGRLIATSPPEAENLVPVHGDFHCNQVLVGDGHVAIIDFDLFGCGDPLHDVGRFLSRFRAYARGRLSDLDAASAEQSFLSTYEILVPWSVDRRRLAWMMATLLVNRQALKPVKKLSGGGPEPAAELLAAAAAIVEGGI